MLLPAVVLRKTTYTASLAREFWRLRHVKPASPVMVIDIFEKHARRNPDSPAILCGEDVLSYGALDALADRCFVMWKRERLQMFGQTLAAFRRIH